MDAYTSFARVYDTFMDNIPYEEWAAYLKGLLKEYGVNDGLHYVDDAFDIEVCKETFHSIFRHMQQEQHYNMMMNNK